MGYNAPVLTKVNSEQFKKTVRPASSCRCAYSTPSACRTGNDQTPDESPAPPLLLPGCRNAVAAWGRPTGPLRPATRRPDMASAAAVSHWYPTVEDGPGSLGVPPTARLG